MAKTADVKDLVCEFLSDWGADAQIAFLKDIVPLFELYDFEDENDWVEAAVGKENENNVRLIRTAYLMSKIADFHASRLCTMLFKYKGLWKKMERHIEECNGHC